MPLRAGAAAPRPPPASFVVSETRARAMTAYLPGSPVASDSAMPAPIQSSEEFSVRFVNGTIATVSAGDPPA